MYCTDDINLYLSISYYRYSFAIDVTIEIKVCIILIDLYIKLRDEFLRSRSDPSNRPRNGSHRTVLERFF